MGTNGSKKLTRLADAALALDEQLTRFEQLVDGARRGELNGQQHLERAAHAAKDALSCREALAAHMQALSDALGEARTRHEATARALEERVREIQSRTEQIGQLMRRFGALGEAAATVTVQLAELQQAASTGEARDPVPALRAIDQRMVEIAADAGDLTTAARAAGLDELSQQIEGLRQKIASARNKVSLISERLGKR